jgi:hypothetical protein
MKSDKETYFKNRGVKRNKRPLKNIVYMIDVNPVIKDMSEKYDKYKFKDLGYLVLTWKYDEKNSFNFFHGFIEPEKLKELIGEKQWNKFCQGKREFIIQRRIDGKNI